MTSESSAVSCVDSASTHVPPLKQIKSRHRSGTRKKCAYCAKTVSRTHIVLLYVQKDVPGKNQLCNRSWWKKLLVLNHVSLLHFPFTENKTRLEKYFWKSLRLDHIFMAASQHNALYKQDRPERRGTVYPYVLWHNFPSKPRGQMHLKVHFWWPIPSSTAQIPPFMQGFGSQTWSGNRYYNINTTLKNCWRHEIIELGNSAVTMKIAVGFSSFY